MQEPVSFCIIPYFIFLHYSDFHMTDTLLIAVHAFVSRESMSISVETP